jgi:DNA polymerase-1
MKNKDLLKLLESVKKDEVTEGDVVENNRILIIDGLNLFFRNFAILNTINTNGYHVGGLGGFFRSLGFLMNQINPNEVYLIFDGIGSSDNRRNLVPGYKSGRNISRITNWDVFENLEEEDDSKINQITRIIQYVKTLPVKMIALDKVEADDVIAYLTLELRKNPKNQTFIVSSDKDYIQLIDDNVILYRPVEREFFTKDSIIKKYGISPKNFILYKTLLGDNSDTVKGVKGLGAKGIIRKFPELMQRDLDLDDIFEISKLKFKENIIYARILQDSENLRKNYKIMNLLNPMMDTEEKEYVDSVMNSTELEFHPKLFLEMYNLDGLGKLVSNVEYWVNNTFKGLIKN